MKMRAPLDDDDDSSNRISEEPKSSTTIKTNASLSIPTYQVPRTMSAAAGAAAVVQVARATGGGRAAPPESFPLNEVCTPTGAADDVPPSVISGSSCHSETFGNSNLRMQSVTENCLLKSVTVPKIQRIDHGMVAHNNSFKLVSKFGALFNLPDDGGLHIPNQKSEDEDDDNYDHQILEHDHRNIRHKQQYNRELMMMMITMRKKRTTTTRSDNHNDDDEEKEMVAATAMSRQPLRLRGGGESSLSTGTSGWGSPPSQQANNSNNTNGNKTNGPQQQQPPPAGQQANNNAGWSQPGGGGGGGKPGATNGSVSTAGVQPPPNAPTANVQNNGPTSTTTTNNNTKQQLEQLNSMRESIFSQDGWGGQYVNQDSTWEVPTSPEPPHKMDGTGAPPPWKPSVNNGTELWEANLRNGGQPPPQPQQKTPWGHTPSTNIGGTWGEDDDATDSANVWTGVPSAAGNQPPQWGGGQGGNANNGAMWGGGGRTGPKKETEWGAGANPNAGGWCDPRSGGGDPRQPGGGMEHPRGAGNGGGPDLRAANSETLRLLDAREQMRQMTGGGGDMRGDPRGITGRLNGAGAEAFWGQGAPQHANAQQQLHHHNKMSVAPSGGGGGGNGVGWEEPSPPSQRRNMPNYDDGTSLWGNPQQGSHSGSQWKDLSSIGPRGAANPQGMTPQARMKAEVGGVWGSGQGQQQHGRNGSWDDGGSGGGPVGGWDDPVSWAKQKMGGGGGGNVPLWDENEWGGGGGGGMGHKPPGKAQPPKDVMWNSKQYRMLVDLGYKKDEVENMLRMRDMNGDDSVDLLNMMRNPRDSSGWGSGGGGGGRHDDHYDHPPFNLQRYPPTGGPGGGFQPGGAPNLLNNMANSANNNGGGGNSSLINTISPAVVQKMFTQGGGGQPNFGGGGGSRSMQPQSQPSTQQLRMLVQQIQMAVQAGYLNHQILNQPLAPTTLVLLNTLLQQIKNLQQLNAQQSLAPSHPINGKPSSAFMQCSVMITKTKQTIANLQNQIAAQQATYVKQQQHQNSMSAYDSFKQNSMPDSINSLQTNFSDLGINKDPQLNQQQSRLTQWINKDKEDVGDFSRAPGSASKPVTSPNMNPLGLNPSDGPWSTGRSGGDTGWPDSGVVPNDVSNDPKDNTPQWSTAPPPQPSLTDLVPEFEPGKPWKGVKTIEDDPTITPGSVVRSPLSIATIKDSDLFNMNPAKSPPAAIAVSDALQSLSLGSTTWSFNPSAPQSTSAFTSPPGKLPSSKIGLDLGPASAAAASSELWGAPKSSRGPPPGLSGKGGGGGGGLANSWSANAVPWGGNQRASGSWGGSSQWLLLRNLTAQIDGSTLRTLCMQHGPLQSFHLYLHQGFALAKYSSREEAIKAQTALNNCVLGNTTILAENPTDWDANMLLQQVASQQSGSSSSWRGSASKQQQQQQQSSAADGWTSGWPNNAAAGANLWAAPQLDGADAARGTPSSLNSFLPNDLLGGESM